MGQILSDTPDELEYKRTTLTVSTVALHCSILQASSHILVLPWHICSNIPG